LGEGDRNYPSILREKGGKGERRGETPGGDLQFPGLEGKVFLRGGPVTEKKRR